MKVLLTLCGFYFKVVYTSIIPFFETSVKRFIKEKLKSKGRRNPEKRQKIVKLVYDFAKNDEVILNKRQIQPRTDKLTILQCVMKNTIDIFGTIKNTTENPNDSQGLLRRILETGSSKYSSNAKTKISKNILFVSVEF